MQIEKTKVVFKNVIWKKGHIFMRILHIVDDARRFWHQKGVEKWMKKKKKCYSNDDNLTGLIRKMIFITAFVGADSCWKMCVFLLGGQEELFLLINFFFLINFARYYYYYYLHFIITFHPLSQTHTQTIIKIIITIIIHFEQAKNITHTLWLWLFCDERKFFSLFF